MIAENCLKEVVGLSKNDCPCTGIEDLEGASLSKSGYFIDDPSLGIPIKFVKGADCGSNGIWSVLENAREQGIKDFVTDLVLGIDNQYIQDFKAFSGPFGDKESTGYVVPINGYEYGVKIISKGIRGTFFVLKGIWLSSKNGGSKDVKVYSYRNEWKLETTFEDQNFGSNNYEYNQLNNPISYPLTDENGNPIHYAVVYSSVGDELLNSQINCGCTGSTYDKWGSYVYGSGILTSDINGHKPDSKSKISYGVSLDVNFKCLPSSWLCYDHDYNEPSAARVMAKIIQLYCINKTIDEILRKDEINRYTLTPKEVMFGVLKRNAKIIAEKMEWLILELGQKHLDCYSCKQSNQIIKHTPLI